MPTQDKFRFKKLDHIGIADAEDDRQFLDHCFIDVGDLDALRDCSNARRIVLGRTGSGKTALLNELADEENHIIHVKPESLALSYISNSTILNFILELGIKLDIFFRLLWRHVFTVEILKTHFHINNENTKASFIERIKNIFREDEHAQALEYLETWGKSFWQETEYRIKELTTKFEEDIKTSIGTSVPPANMNIEGVHKLSAEQKQDVIHRAQHVVNKVQIRQLSEVVDLLAAVLSSPQKRYYILIDRLDENWIEDKLRYLLIRALIETVKDFLRVRQAKIVVAIRYDLIDRVFRLTRDAGFQEEKYESLYLPIQWTRGSLEQVLDTRINYLVSQRYTKQTVGHKDLLPRTVNKQPTIDYIIDRTLMRPRDIIAFFNFCISQAVDSPKITSSMLKEAEGEYSRARLRSLADEWHADYPTLMRYLDLIKNRKPNFSLEEITEEQCEDVCLALSYEGLREDDELAIAVYRVISSQITPRDFRQILVEAYYRVGLIGLKLEAFERTAWSYDGRRSISSAEIDAKTRVAIHPCFWRALGIREE